MGQEHIHGMSAKEDEYPADTPETEQVAASEVGEVNRDNPVEDFQKFLAGRTLPKYYQCGENQQMKQEQDRPGYLFLVCVLPGLPASKKVALGAVHTKNHGKSVMQQVGVHYPEI